MSVHEIFQTWDALAIVEGQAHMAEPKGAKHAGLDAIRQIETFYNGDDAIIFDPSHESLKAGETVLAVSKAGAGGDYVYKLTVKAVYDRHDGRKKAAVSGGNMCVAHQPWIKRNDEMNTSEGQLLRWSKRKDLGL